MTSVRGGQKRALNSPELEFQAVVGHHIGAGNKTWVEVVSLALL